MKLEVDNYPDSVAETNSTESYQPIPRNHIDQVLTIWTA